MSFRTYVVCFQTKHVNSYIKMLNMYSKLSKYQKRDLSLESLVIEVWEQKALEEAEEAKHEPKERTVKVAKPTEGFGLEAGIKGFEDVYLMKQRAVTNR